MNIWHSAIFFGVPGLAIFIGLNVGVPEATAWGVPVIVSWSVALWLPIVLLLIWVLLQSDQHKEGSTFRERFRLTRMRRQHWIAVLLGFVAVQLCELLFFGSTAFLAGLSILPIPPVLPELFSPYFNLENGLDTFFGIPVERNWWLVGFWLGWLVVNIGGEELLWRGYALPLQERVLGRSAWLVNGLCWNLLVHAFMWWNALTLLPVSLAIPYLVQRYQNTWIGIYIHGLGNLLVLLVLVPSIGGWI